MKKIFSTILTVMLLLSIASVSFTTNAASYNSSAAVNYALSHWNDGVGLCAEFVSNTLRAANISIPNDASYYGYYTQSYNNNSGILEYWTNPYTCSAPLLKYLATKYRVITNPSDSQISVADIVFMKNSSGSRDGHVGICVSNNGRAVYAAHNRATKTGTFSSSYPCTYVVKMGESISAHTHVWTGGRVYEGDHPHRISVRCKDYATCGGFYWTDEYFKDKTCPKCNPAHTHVWTGGRVYEGDHPHRISVRCKDYATCGGFYWTDEYFKDKTCSKCNPAARYYYLDVNAYLDGNYRGDVSGIATVDVYIGGKRVANDVSDYYEQHKAGTKFKITDIRVKSGYKYSGKSSYSGTINSSVNIKLPFSSVMTVWATNFKLKSAVYCDAYSDVNLTNRVGRCYKNDVVTVKELVYNPSLDKVILKIECPWQSNGRSYQKTVYVALSQFKVLITKYVDAYSAVDGSKIGRAYPGDQLACFGALRAKSTGQIWLRGDLPWGSSSKTVYLKATEIY